MTELEHLLITNLERMETELQAHLESQKNALAGMETRLLELERHAPRLSALCEELEQTLRKLNRANRP